MLKRLIILLLALYGNTLYAQERLTLQDAIAITLRHNFDIQIAEASLKQADANNTIGNAGMLPNINGTGVLSRGTANTRIEFAADSTGFARAPQVNPNAATSTLSGGVQASWRVFDGGRMFIVKKQLSETEKLTEVQLKEQVQLAVSTAIQAYAQVVWQQQQGAAIDTGLILAQTRMLLSQVRFETGAASKVDFLQARVDYNSRRSDSLFQQAQLAIAFANLNVAMGRDDAERTYEVDDSLVLNTTLKPTDKEVLDDINLTLDVYRRNAYISRLNARIARTYHLPTLDVNGGYTYSRTTSQAGFSAFNRAFGPSGNLTLNLPIFQGGNIRRQAKVAALQSLRDDLVFQRQNTELGRQYRTAWKNYEVSVAAYDLEKENILYAKENMDIQRARFRVGIATTLETREAETSYVEALGRLYTAAYNLKINEIRVLELEGALVNDKMED